LAFGYADTADLKFHLEAASGLSLTEFFNDWLYGQGYPSYQFQVQNLANNQVQITVNQTQSHPSVSFYEMPLPVRLLGANGQQANVILNNTNNNQIFIENVPFAVTSMLFDVEKQLISKNNLVTLDTPEIALNTMMRIFPNPTSSILNLTLSDNFKVDKVIFYNAVGQVISISTATSWDVSGFANGVYFLKVFTSFGTKTFNFIKS
jgi:hypothetical protein